ncbi:MAG: hypothetical protein Q8O37_07620 [Sulfuricellaceae bacterium]|nr:hypothetical protein [Sulfuricellaceae bacterium]
MIEYYRDLAEQLANMPGGAGNLREEFFGSVTLSMKVGLPLPTRKECPRREWQQSCSHGRDNPPPPAGEGEDVWTLKSGGTLALMAIPEGQSRLLWSNGDSMETIAEFPAGLSESALAFNIPAIGLAFLVLVMGGVSDDGMLKKILPEVDKCAKGLLLIAVCRLCG